MSFKTIEFLESYEGTPGVGLLRLNRPQALNALNQELLNELQEWFAWTEKQKSLRVVIVTGQGDKAFVAGADIKEMQNHGEKEALQMAVRGQALFDRFERAPFVSVAAINGFALGGGLELAMACDFIVASKSARWGLPEVSLGLIPGYGGTQRLSRYVGKAQARLITLTGEIFNAQQGHEWGLFAQITEPSELLPLSLKIARSVASRAPLAVSMAKRAITEGADFSQKEGQSLEAELFGRIFATADHHEGIQAFIEKRPPKFQGE